MTDEPQLLRFIYERICLDDQPGFILIKGMNEPYLRVRTFLALLLLSGGLRANQLSTLTLCYWILGLEELSSRDRIILKSNR